MKVINNRIQKQFKYLIYLYGPLMMVSYLLGKLDIYFNQTLDHFMSLSFIVTLILVFYSNRKTVTKIQLKSSEIDFHFLSPIPFKEKKVSSDMNELLIDEIENKYVIRNSEFEVDLIKKDFDLSELSYLVKRIREIQTVD